MDGHYASIWEFEVSASTEAEFRRYYGPNGSWVELFRRDPAYIEMLLLKDISVPGRYLTIDRWRSLEDYQSFRERVSQQYAALDDICEKLTIRETELGAFIDLSKN
jgi:heme-degrading monooxygenase HmoA